MIDAVALFVWLSVIVQTTLYVPTTLYVCVVMEPVPEVPSPKSQEKLYGDTPPAAVQVNDSGCPVIAAGGFAVAEALNAGLMLVLL